MTAICIPVVGPSIAEAVAQVAQAKQADLLELRLDLIRFSQVEELRALLGKQPVIFTIKGNVSRQLGDLLHLRPHYVDFELEHYRKIKPHIPTGIQTIVSCHDFEGTPDDLEGLGDELQSVGADYCKLATYARSAVDALRMVKLCKCYPNLIGVCMGNAGIVTRVLGPLFGIPWTYAALDEVHLSAPGQLPVETLLNQYRFRSLGRQTRILGVIGDPVDRSPGVPIHNRIYQKLGLDAVYLPFPLPIENLSAFFPLAVELNLYGMSVTMPLKEAILPFITDEGGVGAVNTLRKQEEAFVGTNFDGVGALDAVGEVAGKRVAIIGAGGAAAAIAWEAKKRGAEVSIRNRTLPRAKKLASRLGGEWGSLEGEIEADVVIQCTSAGMEPSTDNPVTPHQLPTKARVLEVVIRPQETPFLKAAKAHGCQTIPGTEMWKRQAARQIEYWFGVPHQQVLQVIEEGTP